MRQAFNTKRLLWVIAMTFVENLSAQQQPAQANDLQQQLQQLKQQYERTTNELQERITVLEQEIEKQNQAAAV